MTLPEQRGLVFPPTIRRRNATAEEIAARRTGGYPKVDAHRAGFHSGLLPEDQPYITDQKKKKEAQQPSRYDYADDGDYQEQPKTRTTSVNYRPVAETRTLPRTRWIKFHWLVYVGVIMFIMIGGWAAITHLNAWWQDHQDYVTYGYPRTYQTDAIVGHHDSAANESHFIAINLHRQIVVIEIPGGDPTKAQVYIGPTLLGDGVDSVPVTVSFEDTTGKGKLDMVIHIGDQKIIFTNDGTKFVSPSH